MQKKSGIIGECLRISAFLLVCFCGYSMAQDDFPYIEPEPSSVVSKDNLDSAYAVSKKFATKSASETWWSRNKNIMRTIFFVVAGSSAGIAIWQNSEAGNEKDNAAIWYNNAQLYVVDQNMPKYRQSVIGYNKTVDNVSFHENMRNGLYVGAGILGIAGIVSLCF